MLAITHLVVSLLLIQLMMLDKNDAFVALMFGVFIDLDHLMGLGNYARPRGISSIFNLHSIMQAGGQWKSMLHSPMAVAVVAPLSTASRLAIPLIFWSVHIGMDYLEESVLGNFSSTEAILLAFAGIAFIGIRYAKHLESAAEGTLRLYLKDEIEGMKGLFRKSFQLSLDRLPR